MPELFQFSLGQESRLPFLKILLVRSLAYPLYYTSLKRYIYGCEYATKTIHLVTASTM